MVDEEKKKKVEVALKSIYKQYGEGAANRIGDDWQPIETFSSGSIGIDYICGNGVPKGRIIEALGQPSSGKSSLALHIISEAQKLGEVAYIDAEHALDPTYAKNIGVDIRNLIVSQPDYGEQALDIAEALVKSGGIECIVIDSVASLVPKTELEGGMEDQHIGLQARMMSQCCRKLAGITARSGTTIIFINQIRTDIMKYGMNTTGGGKALKFYSSVRLEMKQKEKVKNNQGEIVSIKSEVNCVKNKVAPPFKKAQIEIEFGKGISKTAEIVDYGIDLGIIDKSGSWYSYNGENIAQGRDNTKEVLESNLDLKDEIEGKVRKELFDKDEESGTTETGEETEGEEA